MSDPRLTALARCHDIETSYWDVWGNQRDASDDTLRAILATMGVDAASAEQIDAALAAHEQAQRERLLPGPVVIAQTRLSQGLGIRLPASGQGEGLAWRVTEETGQVHNGVLGEAQRGEGETASTGDVRPFVGLPLPAALPLGYHKLELIDNGVPCALTDLIVVPERCYQPPPLASGGRLWGGALQLYSLRSARNWGMGDFGDLLEWTALWAEGGGEIVGVNPLHALFHSHPERCSPYSPSSRLFLNTLYLDVEAIADFAESEAAQALVRTPRFRDMLKRLRAAELVDYAGIAAARQPVLELLYGHFCERHLARDTRRAAAFQAWCRARGEALQRYAVYEALDEHLKAEGQPGGWQQWPEAWRDPAAEAVAQFAADHALRVDFFKYLQWQADLQLAAVRRRCIDLGMGIGLYVDLSVSVDGGGVDSWSSQAVYAHRASVGAPPDEFNPQGQDWGLPPYLPQRLQAVGYGPYIAALRANMRHAGALRIDHVMGLARLYWVPRDLSARDGAYVRYPFGDLLGILALESQRNRCLVIGEDLGTVSDDVRAAMQSAGVLSYRLLMFERSMALHSDDAGVPTQQALVAWSTHDLPTMAGYWHANDVTVRDALKLLPPAFNRDVLNATRTRELAELAQTLQRYGMLPDHMTVEAAALADAMPGLSLALHTCIARSPAQIMMVQAEDVLGLIDQANMPGTVNEHPNWRRKLPLRLEQWRGDTRFRKLAAALAAVRGRKPQADGAASAGQAGRAGQAVIPRATYRLQLHREFTFKEATALIPYLAELGVSHVYCSPYLRARSGSNHGYDVIDHNELNPEIGTREAYDEFQAALKSHGLMQMADIVPNHMCVIGVDNAWWFDVLENGPAAACADYFDIDWEPARSDLAHRVLVPVLGDHYGAVLERGELALRFEPALGAFTLHYSEHRFAIDPGSYPVILRRAAQAAEVTNGENAVDGTFLAELEPLAAAFGALPGRSAHLAEQLAQRRTDKETLKQRLAELAAAHQPLLALLAQAALSFNGTAGDAASFDDLHRLIEAQAYRLAFWRVASDEINYRRFFDINELAALRMEHRAVFEATHKYIFNLLQKGGAYAVRIDHPDGLYDPAAYFEALQAWYRRLNSGAGSGEGGKEPGTEDAGDLARPLYVAVEKIVAPFEHMPGSWAVHGTTGYRFANLVNGVFVDGTAEARVTRVYQSFTDVRTSFEDIAVASKSLILDNALVSELTVLANRLARIARASRSTRDYTLRSLREALAEVIAWFPVYRTYIAEDISESDRHYIEWAVSRARRRSRSPDLGIFDFIKGVLLCETGQAPDAAARRAFARKFQQLTAPVMAKGVEDTAFYIYNRLVSLNDVGGDPAQFGVSVRAFHHATGERAVRWPHTMLATSTHDNKRSEDVRARVNVLSELASSWRLQLRRWARMNLRHKRTVHQAQAPSRNDEYLLYQTLLGSFPPRALDDAALNAYRERVEAYMVKAMREAKVETGWLNPDEAYEGAVLAFVRALLAPGRNAFLDDFQTALAPVAWLGLLNSLSMVLIKYTAPGVPDCYQGNELWDFSLADPDNRRAVDYPIRHQALAQLAETFGELPDEIFGGGMESPAALRALFDNAHDGRAKLYAIWRLLGLRRRDPDLFTLGDYLPLQTAGTAAVNLLAYARRHRQRGLITVAGRLYAGLGVQPGLLPGAVQWSDTRIELGFLADGTRLYNVLDGTTHEVADGGLAAGAAFANYPGAVLIYERS